MIRDFQQKCVIRRQLHNSPVFFKDVRTANADMATIPPTFKDPGYYDDYVDFAALALQDNDFAKVYNAKGGKVDLQDPKALQ